MIFTGVTTLLATCGSEGLVKLWHYSQKHLPTLLTSVNSKCRLTSLITTGASSGDVDSSSDDDSEDEELADAAHHSSPGASLNGTQQNSVGSDSDDGGEDGENSVDQLSEDIFDGRKGFSRFFRVSRRQRSNLFFHLFAQKRKRLLRKKLKAKLHGTA
jgi:hypothetical protein